MEAYKPFIELTGNQLWVKRHGWFKPTYELMDEIYSFGKLHNEGVWKPKSIIETATDTWIITRGTWGGITITANTGEIIGTAASKLFSRKLTLTFGNGSVLTFYNPSIWKGTYIWATEAGEELLRIEPRAFKAPVITFTAQPGKQPHLLLLAFLSLEIHLTRQRHAAVAAAS
jgi:hypothetical protein